MDAQVRHEDLKKGLHDVHSFIGACNFYRGHIKNFAYTSAIPTNLINTTTTWRSGRQEQQGFDELKDKVANTKCLGVPKAQGEIIHHCSRAFNEVSVIRELAVASFGGLLMLLLLDVHVATTKSCILLGGTAHGFNPVKKLRRLSGR